MVYSHATNVIASRSTHPSRASRANREVVEKESSLISADAIAIDRSVDRSIATPSHSHVCYLQSRSLGTRGVQQTVVQSTKEDESWSEKCPGVLDLYPISSVIGFVKHTT